MPNRIIRESICTSDSVDKLSWFEEVLFYRLIVNCDDFGRFDGRAAVVKNRLFPLKENLTLKTVENALHGLASAGLIALYVFEGKRFLYLPTWGKYQTQRAKVSKFPSPDEGTQADEIICKQMRANVPVFENRESRIEFAIRDAEDSAEPQAASTPLAISLPLNDGTEYSVSVEQCQEWAGLYPAVDVIQQLRNMRGWLDANPAKRKTKRGINAFIVRWLAKEQDKGGAAAQYGRAAKPGYGVQGHHDELNPMERAAVDRLLGPPPKGADKMRHGVQTHGDELDAFQLAAVDRILAENEKEDETGDLSATAATI